MSTYQDQIYALRTAEFAADGDECVRRDDASRIASKADAEVAKLRAENERLNDLAWRYRGELNQAQEEFAKLKYERLPAIKAALDDLNALLPASNPQ